MKKSKLIKLLVSALSLCLLIGAMVGITSFATDGGGETNPTVKVVAENVSYGDQLYLYYAVYAENVGENFVKLKVYDANGALRYTADPVSKPLGTVGAAAGQYTEDGMIWLKNSSDELKLCYVFVTSGVAAKEINTVEIVKPVIVDAEGNEVASGENKSYSVEDYLYTKLYGDKELYAIATADKDPDGLAIQRRTLYYSMLKYGATAQALLAPKATDIIADTGYFRAPGSYVTSTLNNGEYDELYLDYDYSKLPAGKAFLYWSVETYDAFGKLLSLKNVATGTSLSIAKDEVIIANAVYGDTESLASDTTITAAGDGVSAKTYTVEGTNALYVLKSNNGSATIDSNGLTLKNAASDTGTAFHYNLPSALSSGTANVAIFEADMTIAVDKGPHFAFSTSGESAVFTFMYSKSGGYFNTSPYKYNNVENRDNAFLIKADEKIRFRIEYYEAAKAADAIWKVYVNGELAYSGSDFRWKDTTYNAYQAEDIYKFNIGFNNNAVGSMTFDNVILTHANIDTYDKTAYQNKKDTAVSFNDSRSNAFVTTKETTDTFVKTRYDNGDKVLYIHDGNNSGAAGPNFTGFTRTDSNYNKVAAEFDFKLIGNSLASSAGMELELNGGGHSSATHLYFINSDGDKVYMQFNGGRDTVEIGSVDEWINIRMEYWLTSADVYGEAKACLNILKINDNEIYRSADVFSACKYIPTVSGTSNLHIMSNSGPRGDYLLDNIKHERIYDESCAPTIVPEETDFVFNEAGETFEGDLNSNIRFSSSSVCTVIDAVDNKVLKMVDTDTTPVIYADRALAAEENVNYSVISFDIKIGKITRNGNFEIWLYGSEKCGGANMIPYLTANTSGAITVRDLRHQTEIVDAGLTVGEWAHVDIVFDYAAGTWTYAVNGTIILTGDGMSGGTLTNIKSFKIGSDSSFQGLFYLDNVNFVQSVEAPALAPAN